jgi:hypothetical protein
VHQRQRDLIGSALAYRAYKAHKCQISAHAHRLTQLTPKPDGRRYDANRLLGSLQLHVGGGARTGLGP